MCSSFLMRLAWLFGNTSSCVYLHSMYMHIFMTQQKQARRRLVAAAREAVRACAGLNIRLAARRITQFIDARLDPTGLSIAQFGLMAQIAAAAEDDTIGALAGRLDLDQSTLSRN